MWGDVTPAERLRALARRGSGDDLAAAAAAALAGYSSEPASLVVACRRVVAHHPADPGLLWACSRLLTAADPADEAETVVDALRADPTGRNLGRALPLVPEGEVVAALGWTRAIDEACADRIDLPVVAYRVRGADPTGALRNRLTDRSVRVLDSWGAPAGPVAVLLVPALVLGPEGALVSADTEDLLAALTPTRSWLVVPEGHCLPGPLARRIAAAAGPDYRLVPNQTFDRATGPRGSAPAPELALRPSCAVATEILRS